MLKDSPCGYHIASQCQLGFAADQTALPTLTGELRFFSIHFLSVQEQGKLVFQRQRTPRLLLHFNASTEGV